MGILADDRPETWRPSACSSLEVATGLAWLTLHRTSLILTRTHRYPLYVADYPDLHHYHRENLYTVMQLGELDLFASFVDTLRQYGGIAENEVQVRDGSRFHAHDLSRQQGSLDELLQEGETDAEPDDYDIVYYPWTGV